MSNYTTGVHVDLSPGCWSTLSVAQLAVLNDYDGFVQARGNVFNALQHQGDPRSLIEKATGGPGDDWLTGNPAANRLLGGEGGDTLVGGAGDDTLDGGGTADLVVYAGDRSA